MLNQLSHLTHSSVTATDGEIGHVNAVFFDDHRWAIRYLVVDTGTWLQSRQVLISPYSVRQPLGTTSITLALTRQQVEKSPDIDTHQPVSRQHEREFLSYYSYPPYWTGSAMWGVDAYPMLVDTPTREDIEKEEVLHEREVRAADSHLRSSAEVIGYDIEASNDSIGHIQDFIFDEESWAIRYLVIDTRNWWPGGKKVLVATNWIDRIEWSTKTVHVSLTRDQIKNSPEYDEALLVSREYEESLHAAYDRPGYWR